MCPAADVKSQAACRQNQNGERWQRSMNVSGANVLKLKEAVRINWLNIDTMLTTVMLPGNQSLPYAQEGRFCVKHDFLNVTWLPLARLTFAPLSTSTVQ